MTPPLFLCPHCFTPSWNPHDAEENYCGRCHWWTADPILGRYTAEVVAVKERYGINVVKANRQ